MRTPSVSFFRMSALLTGAICSAGWTPRTLPTSIPGPLIPQVEQKEDWGYTGSVQPSPHGRVIVGWTNVPMNNTPNAFQSHMGATYQYDWYNAAWGGFGSNAKWNDLETIPQQRFEEFGTLAAEHLWRTSEETCIETCFDDCTALGISDNACFNICTETVQSGDPWSDISHPVTSSKCALSTHPDPQALYVDLWTGYNGDHSPNFLATESTFIYQSALVTTDAVPTLADDYASRCALGAYCAGSENENHPYENAYNDLDELWAAGESAFTFDHPEYLFWRMEFMNRFLSGMKGLDRFNALYAVHLNGESGEFPSLLMLNYRSAAELDAFAIDIKSSYHSLQLNRHYLDPSLFVMNLDRGGRAVKQLAVVAAEEGFTIGTHGPKHVLHNQFLQHLPHIQYDGITQSYLEDRSANPFGGLHFDNEYIHNADSTDPDWRPLGAYRQFRWFANAGIALGADSMLFEEESLGFVASYVEDYERSGGTLTWTDYVTGVENKRAAIAASPWAYPIPFLQLEDIDPFDAVDHLRWLRSVIGHGPDTTPEAFCMLTAHGHAVPPGVDVEEEVAQLHAHHPDDWNQVATRPDGSVINAMGWQEQYLTSPRVSHYGRYCNLLPAESEGQPTRPFDRYGSLGDDHGNWDAPTLRYCASEDDADCGSAYEAWAPDPSGALRFRLNPSFAGTQETVQGITRAVGRNFLVKVHFSVLDGGPPMEGSFRIGYHAESGWQTTQAVSIDPSMHADDIYTATVALPRAMFRQGGPGGSDLAIEHVSGAQPAVLAIRIIDPSRVDDND